MSRFIWLHFFTSVLGRHLGPRSLDVGRSSFSVVHEPWPDALADCTGACNWLHRYYTRTWSQSACRRKIHRTLEFRPLLLNHLCQLLLFSLGPRALYIQTTFATPHYSMAPVCFHGNKHCWSFRGPWWWFYVFWQQDEIDWRPVGRLVDQVSQIVKCLSSEWNHCPTIQNATYNSKLPCQYTYPGQQIWSKTV